MTAVLIATIVYTAVLYIVGVIAFKKVHTLNEFCIGARTSGSAEVGLSGQISELGFFIFVLIPAEVYLSGLGRAWIIAGLFIGTMLIWYLMSFRMMRYSIRYQNVYTLPDYYERRFGRGDFLPVTAAVINIVFDFVVAAALIRFLSAVISDLTGMKTALLSTIIVVFVMGFIILSGYVGSVRMDKVNAGVIIAALLAIPAVTIFIFKADELIVAIMNSRVVGGVSRYLNLFRISGESISWMDIVNQLSWGLIIMGLPGLMVRYLSIGKAKTAKHGMRAAILYTLLALFFTVVGAVLYRAFLYPMILKTGNNHLFISKAVNKLIHMDIGYKIAGGVIFAGLLAAIVSMLISEMHNACVVIYCSLIRPRLLRKLKIKKNLRALRLIMLFVTASIFGLSFIDLDPITVIESAFICVGSAFGPCTMLSLYFRRMNRYGAAAGIISGTLVSLAWRFLAVFKENGEITDIETLTGINPILPAFIISTLLILVVSALTPDVSEAVKKDHDDVKNRIL